MVIVRKRGEKMKIIIRLEDLMWENRIKSINQLSEKTGIARATLTRLKKQKSQGINTETLVKLCEFFSCELDELLLVVTEEEYEKIMQ